jgi:hypothetical protein
MEETILKRMYDLAYCAGVNNRTRPILKNKGLNYDECLQKIKDEQLILSGVVKPLNDNRCEQGQDHDCSCTDVCGIGKIKI